MPIPPEFKITPRILKLISKIESLRMFFQSYPLSPEIISKIERVSLLKSSLYSARIEGNPLTLAQVQQPEKIADRQKKLEVFNIIDGLKFINANVGPGFILNEEFILKLHSVVMRDLMPEPGRFRNQPGAIFNSTGIAVYVAPLPEKIREHIRNMLEYANAEHDFPIIPAVLSHLIFEKIHPFIDGNGRVGRLLIPAILRTKNYDFPVNLPVEEFINENRNSYYDSLDKGIQHTQVYVEFMLEGITETGENLRKKVIDESNKNEEVILPPRQEEILMIIRDHRTVTMDFLKRRFYKVPVRTLSYDLKRLADQGLIVKVRKTRGSFYRIKKI